MTTSSSQRALRLFTLQSLFPATVILLTIFFLSFTATADQTECALRPELHAFVFYGKEPTEDVLNFAIELSEATPFDIYFVCDNENYVWHDALLHPKVQIVTFPKSENIKANFTHAASYTFSHTNSGDVSVWAHDRALLLASSAEFAQRYCRVWLIEDDVFIPSVEAALHVDKLAADYDYVSTSKVPSWPAQWSHWGEFADSTAQFEINQKHWRHNMMNAVSLSTRYLSKLRDFAKINGRLAFSEAMLPTFVLHWNLTHLKLNDLTMEWRLGPRRLTSYSWRVISAGRMKWFHPMKDQELRKQFRQALKTGENPPPPPKLQGRKLQQYNE